MKPILYFILLTFIACSPARRFSKDRVLFNASAERQRFRSVADMNDAYFVIRENGFFEFYRQLFDSVKNSSFPGKYSISNDTLMLKFYDRKGEKLLGRKAYIDNEKQSISFYR